MSGKKHIIIAAMLLIVAVIGMIIAMNRTDSSSSEEKLLQAQEYFNLLDYDKVVAIYNDVIANDRSCTEAYVGLAEVYYIRGNSAKALEILERGLESADEEDAIREKMAELFSDEDIMDIKQAENKADDGMLTDIPDDEENFIIPAVESLPAETAVPEETTSEPEAVTETVPPETVTTAPPETTTAAPAPVVTSPPVTTAAPVVTTTAPPVTTTETTTTAKPKSVIPNFVGMTESEAKAAAMNNKLMLEINYEKGSAYPDGTVFKQSRSEGAKVEENTSVTVYICQFDKELQDFYNAANAWGSQSENVKFVTLNEKASTVTVSAGSMKKFTVDDTVMEAFGKCSGATFIISSADISISISSSSVAKTDKLDLSVNTYGNSSRTTVEFGSSKDFGCSLYVTVKDCKIEDFSDKKLYNGTKKIGAVSINSSNQPVFTVSSSGTYVIK